MSYTDSFQAAVPDTSNTTPKHNDIVVELTIVHHKARSTRTTLYYFVDENTVAVEQEGHGPGVDVTSPSSSTQRTVRYRPELVAPLLRHIEGLSTGQIVAVPSPQPSMRLLGGTTFELRMERAFSDVRFKWYHQLPHQWELLAPVVEFVLSTTLSSGAD